MQKIFYPLLIICLLGTFFVFSGWSAFRASTKGSEVTDRDYYSKGLKYNDTLVEKKAARVMGWQLHADLKQRHLQIDLSDQQGNPVAGANGTVIFLGQTGGPASHIFAELSPGRYLVTLPDQLHGEVTVRVDFEHEGARLNRQLLLNI